MSSAELVGALLGAAGLGFILAYPFALVVRSLSAVRASVGYGADIRS